MTRLLAWDADVASPKTKAEMIRLLRQHYPGGEAAGLLTEGIMELGETLCIPNGEARCELCPVRRFCRARLSGQVERYPVKSPPRERRTEKRSVFLLRCGDRYAIRRRPPAGRAPPAGRRATGRGAIRKRRFGSGKSWNEKLGVDFRGRIC